MIAFPNPMLVPSYWAIIMPVEVPKGNVNAVQFISNIDCHTVVFEREQRMLGSAVFGLEVIRTVVN